MKITIEIWQSDFNDEWNCDITSRNNGDDETEYWAVEHFCQLLTIISKRFPKAKFVPLDESLIA